MLEALPKPVNCDWMPGIPSTDECPGQHFICLPSFWRTGRYCIVLHGAVWRGCSVISLPDSPGLLFYTQLRTSPSLSGGGIVLEHDSQVALYGEI
jgi:hypothetical protein